MKTILLLAHNDKGQDARLQAALDLTRAMSGHLTCLDVVEVPVLAAGPWNGAGHGVLVAESQRIEADNRKRVHDCLAREDVPWDWRDTAGDLAQCVADAADLADVIVTSARVTGFLGLDDHHLAADLLIRSHTPILAVPDDLRSFDATSPAIIAWDGSKQATAAMQAAVPLLALASDVILVEVDDGSVETPAEEAAAYLSQHGIRSTIEREVMRIDPVIKTLMDAVARHRAGYVVMGGFTHWRLTEAIFGGVSRSMLLKSSVPLLMAH
ncbi:universal stress protein [Sphingomonas oryzagri]